MSLASTMRESVRSSRRANFYITENSFIDHYARDVGPAGVAVYHALERHVNCETRSTWVSTKKIAELLNLSQRTVQRTLKILEDVRLIRIIRTETMTTYVIVPVPPKGKMAAVPLFDDLHIGDIHVAAATSTSSQTTPASRVATSVSPASDIHDAPNKEEQDLVNKTQEQELFNKELENALPTARTARRILNILGLPDVLLGAAMAAAKSEAIGSDLSEDGIVTKICTEANREERRGIPRIEFLNEYLARTRAEQILEVTEVSATDDAIRIVMKSLKAEAKYRNMSLDETASWIAESAIKDRKQGVHIDKYYFERTKWREDRKAGARYGINKAEQRKLDNLEANARFQQRLRERRQNS